MRDDKRESFRATVVLWNTPLVTARCISGIAALNASSALFLSPDAIASSTLRTKVRTRERRALFTAVRRSILRTIFFADVVLAMPSLFSLNSQPAPAGEGRLIAAGFWLVNEGFCNFFQGIFRALALASGAEKGGASGLLQPLDRAATSWAIRPLAVIDLKPVLEVTQSAV